MSVIYTIGPKLKEKQEVFEPVRHNWSTLIAIEGPGTTTQTGYYGNKPAPEKAEQHPSIVVRTGYAEIRAVFYLEKNISKEEWYDVAMEAMSRPECSLGAKGGTGENGIDAKTIKSIYKGITNISKYPFPPLVPAFCLDEMYQEIKLQCEYLGPCQKELSGVAGSAGAPCKPGDTISYSMCASMPCNCGTAREHHKIVRELERILPTRHQMTLMQRFDDSGVLVAIDAGEIMRKKRSEAAKKGWEKRRSQIAQRIE